MVSPSRRAPFFSAARASISSMGPQCRAWVGQAATQWGLPSGGAAAAEAGVALVHLAVLGAVLRDAEGAGGGAGLAADADLLVHHHGAVLLALRDGAGGAGGHAGGSEVNQLYDGTLENFDPFHSSMAKQTLVKISKLDESEIPA